MVALRNVLLVFVVVFLHTAGFAGASASNGPRPPVKPDLPVISVELSGVIAGIRVGMTRGQVEARGIRLAPEGIDRGDDKKGWVSGPLLVIVDAHDRVEVVSVELRRSRGLRVEGHEIPRDAKLEQIAQVLRRCRSGVGSGGHTLECPPSEL